MQSFFSSTEHEHQDTIKEDEDNNQNMFHDEEDEGIAAVFGSIEKDEKENKVKKDKVKEKNKVKKERKRPVAKQAQCPECGDILSSSSALLLHKRAKHQGATYPCTQCDSVYTTMGNLKVHIGSKHEGTKFQCEYCNYQATQKGLLSKHVKSKHL